MKSSEFSHLDGEGKAKMVDVGNKDKTRRTAVAAAQVKMSLATVRKVKAGTLKKGDILTVAQVAGVLGAKQTANLIPLCHPIMLDHIAVDLSIDETIPGIKIIAEASASEKTGVEMEALTAATIAALTIYDMLKAVEKSAMIEKVYLVEKKGGKSGHYIGEKIL